MVRFSLNLPKSTRLDIRLVKRRDFSFNKGLLPNFNLISKIKKGSRISRYFRHIFEQGKIKRLLGKNLAFAVITSSLIVRPQTADFKQTLIDFQPTNMPTVIHTNISIRHPLQPVLITQKYSLFHPGVDYDGITGDPIYPILEGVVEEVQHSRVAYGNAVYIRHENGLVSLYAHLSKINTQEGDSVNQTTVIGLVGATGRSSGDHLHLEIHQNGVPINPLTLIK